MHWLSLPLLSSLVLALSSPAHSQSTQSQDKENGQGVVPLIYNDHYAPEVLDLLTQGILKYGIFSKDVKRHPKLQQRLDKTLKELKLDLSVGLLGNTVKLDLGLGLFKSNKKARSARHGDHSSHHHAQKRDIASNESLKEKRLLGLELGLTGLLGGDGNSNSGGSLLSIDLGIQTVVDDGWDNAVSTRVMNSGNDNAVS